MQNSRVGYTFNMEIAFLHAVLIWLSLFKVTQTTNVNSYLQFYSDDVAIIKINDRGITDLGSRSFERFMKLEVIDLYNNKVNAIGNCSFKYSPSINILWKLDLSINDINSVAENAFKDLKNLRLLNLRYNRLAEILADHFSGLANLAILNLGENKLVALKNSRFSHLIGLSKLILDFNKIRELNKQSFHGLSNLMFLDIGNNKIVRIQNGTFNYLFTISLRALKIHGNLIDKDGIEILRSLRNRLCFLRADASELRVKQKNCKFRLQLNDLKYGKISTFIDEFGVRRTGNLNYSRNDVNYYLHHRTNNDKSISLQNQKIRSLGSGSLSRFTKLIKLNFNKNSITSIEQYTFSFDAENELQELVLSFNEIAKIAKKAFRNLAALKLLDLTSNKLTVISRKVFVGLVKLETLKLPRNKIAILSDRQFMYLTHLTTLRLQFNRLTSLKNETFYGLLSLKILDFRVNFIKYVEEGTFVRLVNLNHSSSYLPTVIQYDHA